MENTEKTNVKDEIVTSKSTMESNKIIAIIAYMTFIGWIIAIVMNNDKKRTLCKFSYPTDVGNLLHRTSFWSHKYDSFTRLDSLCSWNVTSGILMDIWIDRCFE